jgi:hypothetical protein
MRVEKKMERGGWKVEKKVCPFSKKTCTECAVYRGRHFYLCSNKANRRWEWDSTPCPTARSRKSRGKDNETFNLPADIPVSSAVIFNVEDLSEREEFSRLKEKGEKHDT